jgi:arginyl-tRNA synthetase
VEVATTLMIALKANLPAKVAKIEAVGGFINFYLTPNYFASETGNILEQGENYGRGHWLDKQKIIIEYTDPNILKDFHLGHLMSNVIGESLSRLLSSLKKLPIVIRTSSTCCGKWQKKQEKGNNIY